MASISPSAFAYFSRKTAKLILNGNADRCSVENNYR
jgi:hypothetical protein